MKVGLLVASAVFLAGCVTLPLPPVGDDAGKYGFLEVRVQYKPNFEQVRSRLGAAVGSGKEVVK